MLDLACTVLLISFVGCADGDSRAAEGDPQIGGYCLCVPWVLDADPQSWDEVIPYYTNPPFMLPTELKLAPSLPGQAAIHPTSSRAAAPVGQDGWEAVSRGPRKVKQESKGDWGSIQSQMTVLDGHPTVNWEDPLRRRQWQTDEALRYSVVGPFSLYGQFGAATDEAQQKETKVVGKTGLACNVPVGIPQAALTLRSGPSVSYTDALRPDRVRERGEWVLEVEGRLPLVAGIGLEFHGAALPALNPLDHDRITQDLRLAFPMGPTGKLTLGAKRLWEAGTDPGAATESRQLYLGLEIQH
jgi:hypothetical protein